MAWRWQRLLLAQGDPRPALVARARVLRRVHGRADPADVDRRRRDADLRDVAAASRAHRARRRDGAARARARRRRDGHARRRRLRARRRQLRRRRVHLGRARRSCSRRSCSRSCCSRGARGARSRGSCRCCAGFGSSARCARSTRRSTRTATSPRLLVGVFALTSPSRRCACSRSGRRREAVGVDLSPRIYYVMGPLLFLVLLVPFTINGIAVRESFFVSFLGGLGVDRRPRVRDRLPLLRRHDHDLDPGRAHPRLGEHPAPRAASRPSAVVTWLVTETRGGARRARVGDARRAARLPAELRRRRRALRECLDCGRTIVLGERTCDCETVE